MTRSDRPTYFYSFTHALILHTCIHTYTHTHVHIRIHICPHLKGHLESMKHGRDDISAARKETECGLIFPGNPDVQEDDTVQCFKKKLVPREVTWDLGF